MFAFLLAQIGKIKKSIAEQSGQTPKILERNSVDSGSIVYDFSSLSARRLAIVVASNALFIVTKWSNNITASPAYRESGVTYGISGNTLTITGVATGGYSIISI